MVNLWTDYAGARKIALHKRLAESARRLSQAKQDPHLPRPRTHKTTRASKAGKPTGTRTSRTGLAWTARAHSPPWIAIDDVYVKNGCMHFVPGSHKFGKQESVSLTTQGESIVQKMKERGHKVAEPETIELPAGGVTFHHGCNFHYAGPQPQRQTPAAHSPSSTSPTTSSSPAKTTQRARKTKWKSANTWEHPLHPVIAG